VNPPKAENFHNCAVDLAWSDPESPLSGRVVNIAATALVTDAATALFGEAGVTAATGVMTVGDTLIMCRVTEVVHVAVCML
jgi:hypothetical protein